MTIEAMEELLRRSNLERFIEKFQEEEIDLEVLLLCDEKDLQDLGLPKGPRIKLTRAIAGVLSGVPHPSTVEDLEKQVADLLARVDASEARVAAMEEAARRKEESAQRENLETRIEEVEGRQGGSAAALKAQTKQVASIAQQLKTYESQLASVQELAPNKVLWTIKNLSEKLVNHPPGKHIRAPAFAVCGFLSGIKLDFYPQGRHEEEGHLPEITPRRSTPGQIPSTSAASLALCMPMGIKIQYHLQVGRQITLDSRFADWTWVFHDFRMNYEEGIEDDALTIMFCVAKLHNRRYLIEGDTVFLRSE
jgi:hypothetical protein